MVWVDFASFKAFWTCMFWHTKIDHLSVVFLMSSFIYWKVLSCINHILCYDNIHGRHNHLVCLGCLPLAVTSVFVRLCLQEVYLYIALAWFWYLSTKFEVDASYSMRCAVRCLHIHHRFMHCQLQPCCSDVVNLGSGWNVWNEKKNHAPTRYLLYSEFSLGRMTRFEAVNIKTGSFFSWFIWFILVRRGTEHFAINAISSFHGCYQLFRADCL